MRYINKLFRVICWHDGELRDSTFEVIVLAKNHEQAQQMVEKEFWTLDGMRVWKVNEINEYVSQIICYANSEDLCT